MNFKQVLHWMRHNPLAVGSAVICLGAIIFLFIVRSQGQQLVADAQTRAQMVRKLESYTQTSMNLPPEKVDGSVRMVNGAVNEAAINYLKNVYGQMNNDYAHILNLAERHNRGDATRGRHLPFIDGLFPDPGNREYQLFGAREEFLRIFREMLGPYAEGAQYPRLNAGGPADKTQIDEAIANVERNFNARFNAPGNTGTNQNISEQQHQQLQRDKQRAAMDVIRQKARSIHIYVTEPPFHIDRWITNLTQKPKVEDVWESQLNLWIQQDIIQTISRVNHVSNPDASVIQAPIKRLNKIEVYPGYVGIDGEGGMTKHGKYGTAPSGDTQLPDDFTVAPTGRLSNSIYDVRHVMVDMDVDIQQLPVFMDELVQTNFMSVLKIEMEDVNEYKALEEGFFFGNADVVRLKMTIETLWLRSWTVPLMPKETRKRIGLETEQSAEQNY